MSYNLLTIYSVIQKKDKEEKKRQKKEKKVYLFSYLHLQ